MRFHTVPVPAIFPAQCLCGTAAVASGPYVDTGVEIFNHRIYWCRKCVADAAHEYGGWASAEQVDSLERGVAHWKHQAETNAQVLELTRQRIPELQRELGAAVALRDQYAAERDAFAQQVHALREGERPPALIQLGSGD
jgi:hypothetical protein